MAASLLLNLNVRGRYLERSDVLPYHVTARANNRENFPISPERLWEILGFECLVVSTVYGAEIHALVLMPNHFHMLVTVPQRDLGAVMGVLMRSVTQSVNRVSGRSGHVFGGPYRESLIQETRYYRHALKYVYRNPVRAGLSERVETHHYSSLYGLLGQSHLPFPIHFTRVGMELGLPSTDAHEQLDWLNTPFPAEAEPLIQKGLRRRVFQNMLDRDTRRPYAILDQAL